MTAPPSLAESYEPGSALLSAPATPVAEAGAGAPRTALAHDVAHSVRNAIVLGASLLATWTVALAVRIFLPRHLGPAGFGAYQFADSFTITLFVLTGLGIETYIRKEISTDAEHASDFFGGVLLVRVVTSLAIMIAAVWGLTLAGKPASIRELVVILGAAQILVIVNVSYAALLQAVGSVSGLSLLQVVSKLLWAGGIFGAFAYGGGLRSVAAAMLVAEAVRSVGLAILTRRHVGLRYSINPAATWKVIVASFPYYLGVLAVTVYSRIDVTIMSFLTNDKEVGWYGAASSMAGMAMLLAPLIGWVLLPLTSRAAARSDSELTTVSTRAMEFVLTSALPVSLLIYLASDEIVLRMFGPAFAPSIPSMRIQAPVFVLTYVAMVSASLLIRLERAWTVTWITVGGMILSPLLNFWLIPQGIRTFGHGGAGIGAAIALVIGELSTTAAMTWTLRGRAFDQRSVRVLSKTFVVCLAIVALDAVLVRMGSWRLVVDGVAYLALVVAWGALDLRALLTVARQALRRQPLTQPGPEPV